MVDLLGGELFSPHSQHLLGSREPFEELLDSVAGRAGDLMGHRVSIQDTPRVLTSLALHVDAVDLPQVVDDVVVDLGPLQGFCDGHLDAAGADHAPAEL